jgi:hypothetical protein
MAGTQEQQCRQRYCRAHQASPPARSGRVSRNRAPPSRAVSSSFAMSTWPWP